MIATLNHGMTEAAVCRENGWDVGTRLIGDEGYGPTTITITSIGERSILAKSEHNGRHHRENLWTLAHRDWSVVQ